MKENYQEWEASELFCPNCKRATPVRKRMLLVLADGDKYDYICTVCNQPIGHKMDKKPDNFGGIIR